MVADLASACLACFTVLGDTESATDPSDHFASDCTFHLKRGKYFYLNEKPGNTDEFRRFN